MKIRAVVLAAVLLTSCAGTGAFAATKAKPKPKPVCNLIKDDTGDATYNNAPGNGTDDILTADVASDAKNVTGVIRLAALATPDPQAPFGHGYFVQFTPKGTETNLFVSARTYPQGTTFVYGYSAADPNTGVNTSYTLGQGTGTVDTAKKEVRITAPLSGYKATEIQLTPGRKLIGLTAASYRLAGQGVVPSQNVGPARAPLGGFLLPFDDATGTSYVMGMPSCVKVGD